MPARFEPEEVWRTVEKYGVNVMQVTGDAMARPLADTLERLQGEVDVSSLVLVRQHRGDLLADRQGTTAGAAARVPRDDRLGRVDRDAA